MSWLSRQEIFPLESMVRIDPDIYKRYMPEWDGYVRRDRFSAGSMCHRESGFIQEIATEVALRTSQNVWVDGSLRDGDWFGRVFDDIRERFPEYRIAIFCVSASEDVVRARCAQRARETGRVVPEEVLVASLQAPAASLHKLMSKSDLVARINNDDTPLLRSRFALECDKRSPASPPPPCQPPGAGALTSRRHSVLIWFPLRDAEQWQNNWRLQNVAMN